MNFVVCIEIESLTLLVASWVWSESNLRFPLTENWWGEMWSMTSQYWSSLWSQIWAPANTTTWKVCYSLFFFHKKMTLKFSWFVLFLKESTLCMFFEMILTWQKNAQNMIQCWIIITWKFRNLTTLQVLWVLIIISNIFYSHPFPPSLSARSPYFKQLH